jgi:hypothetical protein
MSRTVELEVCPSCESDDIAQTWGEWDYSLGIEKYYRFYQCHECQKKFERPDRVLIYVEYDVVSGEIASLYSAKL